MSLLGRLARRLVGPQRVPTRSPSPLVVSYTPGKVGGTAVVEAVRQAGLEAHQVHILRPQVLINRAKASFAKGDLPLRHISTGMALRREIIGGERDTRIITGIRDPLEQSLSSFFENLHRRTDGLGQDSDPEALFATWIKGSHLGWSLDWLTDELLGQLGVDILAHPFDRERRYLHLPDHKLLVLRFDCPQTTKQAEISRFVGRDVTLSRANVGEAKPYARAYAAVKKIAFAPDDVIDKVYGSKHARHIWTSAELAEMSARWQNRS